LGSSEEQLNTLGTLLFPLQLKEAGALVLGSTRWSALVLPTGPATQSVLPLLATLPIEVGTRFVR